MQAQDSWKTLWRTCCPALRAIQVIGRQLWSELEFQENPWSCSAATFKQMLWNAAWAPGQSWRGIVGRTSMDSTVSAPSADPQMPSLTDFDQENTLCGSVNASLRELQHYFFALLLFLAKFRCYTSLPGCFWCCQLWEEDIKLLMLGFAEVSTLNKSPPSTIRAGVQGWHWHAPLLQFCAWREYTVFQSYHLFIMTAL